MLVDFIMYYQLNIFDILYQEHFCENEHINEIVKLIEKEFCKCNLKLVKKEYSIWGHVPKLGKRLTMEWDLKIHKNFKYIDDKRSEFINELKKTDYKKIVEEAERYNIEISIAVTPFFIMITTLNKE